MNLCAFFRRATRRPRLAALVVLSCFPAALAAQPFGLWTEFIGDGTLDANNGFLEIPADAALNPTSGITLEAWVQINLPFAAESCRSIIGKDYTKAYWVGVCGNLLRSYTTGAGSDHDAGVLPADGAWTHVAVTSDGSTRKHYINGELVGTFSETGPLSLSSAPVEIGGDASWAYSPNGSINEVRLWNVARTQAEIQASINVPVRTAQAGLVAVWPMFVATDAVGGHNGTFQGKIPPILGPPAESTCGSSGGGTFCLNGKFAVNASVRVGAQGTAQSAATIVPSSNPGSGVFWFFNADDWEILVKVLNGCAVDNQWWVFSAATTNLYYELDVTNVQSGETKRYFNYPGPPAPAVTDVAAFPCP